MSSMFLSYLLLFLTAGLAGLAAGYGLRQLVTGGRRRLVQTDIKEFSLALADVRARLEGPR